MIWYQLGGGKAPAEAVRIAQDAAKEFGVPVGILLGTCECETNFRLNLVSSAGAVGPVQFLPKYEADYFKYAGFAFDLEGWEALRGIAAVYKTYAGWALSRHGLSGADGWRFAVSAHRYGQNSKTCLDMDNKRVTDIERHMMRNHVWYGEDEKEAVPVNLDVKLSDNFTLREFYDPQKYADVIDPDKAPQVAAAEIDQRIVNLLEDLRAAFRKTYPGAVIVLTPHGGYRPDPLNKLVGGASGSQHRKGNAADFRLKLKDGSYLDAATLATWSEHYMDRLGVRGGVGMYDADDTYIHVDARGSNVAWYDSYSSAGCPGQGGRPVTYKQGQKGAGVVLIQRYLAEQGYKPGTADGKYGKNTATAVKAFQKDKGLAADGIFGAKTNAAMEGVLPWTT